jgi:hypothetical protein
MLLNGRNWFIKSTPGAHAALVLPKVLRPRPRGRGREVPQPLRLVHRCHSRLQVQSAHSKFRLPFDLNIKITFKRIALLCFPNNCAHITRVQPRITKLLGRKQGDQMSL